MSKFQLFTLPLCVLAFAACGPGETDPDPETNEEEVITTVNLTFTPDGGGTAVTASWVDSDGDGGDAPTIEDITLDSGTTYTLSVEFLNALEDPAEDITEEIEAEDDEHQIFFAGTNVESEATGAVASKVLTVSYADMDGNGDPIGLSTNISADAAGTGTLRVVLRHLPDLKTSSLAADAATSSINDLPGDSDVDAEFNLTVN